MIMISMIDVDGGTEEEERVRVVWVVVVLYVLLLSIL
jgi:hypothetical protein